jgi:hypothetical protein
VSCLINRMCIDDTCLCFGIFSHVSINTTTASARTDTPGTPQRLPASLTPSFRKLTAESILQGWGTGSEGNPVHTILPVKYTAVQMVNGPFRALTHLKAVQCPASQGMHPVINSAGNFQSPIKFRVLFSHRHDDHE